MEKIVFESYQRKNGHDEFLEWIKLLPKKDSAKLLRIIAETKKWVISCATFEMGQED